LQKRGVAKDHDIVAALGAVRSRTRDIWSCGAAAQRAPVNAGRSVRSEFASLKTTVREPDRLR